jgi:virginiamycin A acetyltransferase
VLRPSCDISFDTSESSHKSKANVKHFFKSIASGIALILVSPLVLLERTARALAGRDVFFVAQGEFLGLFPGKTGSYLRNAFYYCTLRKCPLNLRLIFGSMFTHSEAEIGERVYFGAHCIIGMANIGDDSLLADHVYVLSGGHQHGTADGSVTIQGQPQEFVQISIGKNVWIGTNSVIMADVGDDCVIGAGSVVTRPIPPGTVAVGSPARVIRSRTNEAASAVMSD